MRLSDENTREGRHLTPEERIALQAEEIKQLQQENEQLRAQVARMREALIDYKTFLESFQCTCEPSNETYPGVCCERCCRLNQAKQALAEIDKAIGGKEDAGKTYK